MSSIQHTEGGVFINGSLPISHDFESPCLTASCQPYSISLERGNYLFEVWGSEGETIVNCGSPGRGGYAHGYLQLNSTQIFYIFVGNSKGFNGGGSAGSGANIAGNGGGSTDIRTSLSLNDRILVAGGGGGGSSSYSAASNRYGNPGTSGGNAGLDGESKDGIYHGLYGSRGSSSSGGNGGAGGELYVITTSTVDNRYVSTAGGGGGGYFGGGGGGSGGKAGNNAGMDGNRGNDGSFFYGGRGADACVLSSTRLFQVFGSGGGGGGSSYCSPDLYQCHIQNGNTEIIDPRANTLETGHHGNGYARITLLKSKCEHSPQNSKLFPNIVLSLIIYLS